MHGRFRRARNGAGLDRGELIARSRGTSEHSLDGASMEVDIDASLPKLKKHGRLHALRRISPLGRITYERLQFEGDGTVKNEVIARYLTAESGGAEQTPP